MPSYSFTGFRWTGTYYGSPSTPAVTIDISDDDATLNWFGGDGGTPQTATTSDGLATGSTISGGSELGVRMDFGSDGAQDAIENVAFLNIQGAGWYFVPLPGSGFQEGDTLLGNSGGWVDPGEGWDYTDIICFTPGAQIATLSGLRAVEKLKVGDLVITKDNGLQPIRWIGRKTVTGAHLFADPHLRPVCVKKDAFGPGLPVYDLLVSPQHRMLISGYEAELHFGHREILAPAKSLIDGDKVMTDAQAERTEYIHVLFDTHEVIFANGLETESFHPGAMGLNAVEEACRAELFKVFPELQFGPQSYGPSVRHLLKVSEAYLLQK
ncbi:MAG: Hint domain-containing protein [Rhodobacteraceae bacterium]|nr:Hint domain-containing protein [Paracoccaceae bacterium]